jgi:predicted MFS family arabinose efflux permease
MGQIGAAIGVAFVLGPALGGLLSEIGERAPFAAVAIIAALNLVLCWFLLPETRPPSNEAPDWSELARSLVPAPIRLVTAGHSFRIGLYLYLFFHVTLGFSTLESLLPIFLEQRFARSPLEIGILFTALGVVMILTQVFLIGRLTRRVRESSLLIVGLVLCALALVSLARITGAGQLYPIALAIGVGYGLAWPTFTSLFSQACAERDAGELLGQSQSMSTAGRVLGPIWAGLVMDRFSAGASFIIAAGLLLSAMLAFIASRRALAGDR